MLIFRAIYQALPEHGGRISGMDIHAEDAEFAHQVAKECQLETDRLLTVKVLYQTEKGN